LSHEHTIMTATTSPDFLAYDRSATARLVQAWLLTALVDGAFSSVLSIAFYHSTATRLFQGVASVLIGKGAIDGGTTPALIGVLMHITVAFSWSAVFLMLVTRSARLRALVASPHGTIKVAAAYGPFVWLVMSMVVIPLLTQRPPAITIRWWIQFFGHAPFVGLPIVAMIGAGPRSLSRSS
jgi:hypothetical protein